MLKQTTRQLGAVVLGLVTAGSILLADPAGAAAVRYPYSAKLFARAQSEGSPILVDITATWCPTCRAQNAVINKEMFKPEFAHYVIFDVDFDVQPQIVRQFGATTQSTLIFFKGRDVKARLIGATDPDVIDAMLRRSID